MRTFKKRFGEDNPNWGPNEDVTEFFIRSNSTLAHDIMEAQGYLLLRDVYVNLGFEITRESLSYGWIKGAAENDDFVPTFEFKKIDGVNEYELSFECYSILKYLPKEKEAAE